jgi:peptidoglycan hydrolase FlgJ
MGAVASINAVLGLPTQSVMALQNAATPISLARQTGTEQELHDKFTQFVGETFYGQMFKAMRSTVGKPAYFYGGRAEEVFQGQLDQTMAQELTKSTAATFAEPMFERQFPQFANIPNESALTQLDGLHRR